MSLDDMYYDEDELFRKSYCYDQCRAALEGWLTKQSHDRCWYYPEIFGAIARIMNVEFTEPSLPPREEFERGCTRYTDEQYRL